MSVRALEARQKQLLYIGVFLPVRHNGKSQLKPGLAKFDAALSVQFGAAASESHQHWTEKRVHCEAPKAQFSNQEKKRELDYFKTQHFLGTQNARLTSRRHTTVGEGPSTLHSTAGGWGYREGQESIECLTQPQHPPSEW